MNDKRRAARMGMKCMAEMPATPVFRLTPAHIDRNASMQ